MSDDAGAIAFAEKLLALLDQGSFTATYKFAVLLGLTDLCLAGFTRAGAAPDTVTTHQLAEAVIALYWDQALPFGDAGTVLRQNRGGQATIVALIAAARASIVDGGALPLARVRHRAPARYARLVREVEWKLCEMPLPKLQYVGGHEVRFIYDLAWDDRVHVIKKGVFNDPRAFDNRIRFVDGAGDHLVRLNGLLRPMLKRRWALEVSRMNPAAALDSQLEDHLFGAARIDLTPVHAPLRELQDNRCFYCHGALRSAQVDHFIPWARVRCDAIENLVLAHPACNGNKCDTLAATDHVAAWAARLDAAATDLAMIATTCEWDTAPLRARGFARSLYLPLADDALLWASVGEFVAPDKPRLQRVLA